MEINKLRKTVDSIDSQVVKLLNKRAEVILGIGKLKAKTKGSIYVPEREKEVYKKLTGRNAGPLSNDSLKAIFREIMSSSFELERPLVIAYLGPECTFTHLASIKKFGSSVTYKACETITDIFSEVEKGMADYGVVPIENSIEGAVNHTLDMFIDSPLRICSEIYLEIMHSLLSGRQGKDKIKRVYSKAEVFGQCRLWLESNLPRVELVEVSSTAKAAAIAAREKGPSGCIAGELAAEKYGLRILQRSIQDSSHNVTRFLVVGKYDAKPTGADKTSIMFSVKDKSGALHDMLVPFKKYKINMTKIESRPSKVRAWEYYFFVDLEGHTKNPRVKKAMDELDAQASFVKILGSYPVEESV
ncbi:MAG: prephenate dehydratase [Candidatus Omnitrophica bacterium]|nr:prephenate dehydratase [Candidatus Omnitrophota bacterium]